MRGDALPRAVADRTSREGVSVGRYDFEVFGTAISPRSDDHDPLKLVARNADLAEGNGLDGLLIFYNHTTFDPWITAGTILHTSRSLTPIVALQPYATPPFTAAKTIHSLVRLHGRRVDVNLITGAAREELDQVGEPLDHDGRYERAIEYAGILRSLLSADQPLTHEGRYYRYRNLRAHARLAPDLTPRVFVAGSSPSSRRAAAAVGDVAITHPEPVERFSSTFLDGPGPRPGIGIRVGIVARETGDEAWSAARARYPSDRRAELQVAMKRRSESDWSRRLARLAGPDGVHDEVYWTGAYRSGKGSTPLLVGTHREVADYLERYLALGVGTVILGGALDEEELRNISRVMADLRGR